MRLPKLSFALLAGAIALAAQAQVPAGYPADYAKIVDGAKKEGKVVVYSTTDAKLVQPLIKDFEAAFPGVKVEYTDMNSTEVYNRFISESAANAASADAVWSSSMDLQLKLAADGLAAAVQVARDRRASRLGALEGHRVRDDLRADRDRLQQAAGARRRRAEDARRLHQAPEHQGRQVPEEGHDLRRGEVRGRLHAGQPGRRSSIPPFWDLVKAMGARGVNMQSSTGTMMERVVVRREPDRLQHPRLVRADAREKGSVDRHRLHDRLQPRAVAARVRRRRTRRIPNAGRLWVDYLLSKRGQTITAEQAELYSVRTDITGKDSGVAFAKELGSAVKPIAVSTDLLAGLDQTKRLEFLKQWQAALGRK